MTEEGYVNAIHGEYASIVFKRKSGCGDNCATCKAACKSAAITNNMKNTVNAKVGDKVLIEMKQTAFNKMILWVYVFPLIMMAAGIGIATKVFSSKGYPNYEMLSFIVGLIALVISYIILNRVSKKSAEKKEYTLEIIKIIE